MTARSLTAAQLLYIRQEATMASRAGKEDGPIDHDKLLEEAEAKWEATDGTRLRDVAGQDQQPARPTPSPRRPRSPAPRHRLTRRCA